ncbi:methyltransferase [Kribbella monticola]|uniref:methyltransferase n=1 Tax=Kribbella monticola TaxID=2185285 RepID=UPI0018E4E7FD|nr:methyltransferase [Kribbella monticola]
MITGFRLSAALSVAAELAISDRLADGPRTIAELAAEAGADEDALLRLLRVLCAVGVYTEADGSYTNTPLGESLRTGVPGSLRPLARMMQDPALWAAWGNLTHSIRTGENAFKALHGVDVWEHRTEHPEFNEIFNDNMAALSSVVAGAVAEAYDFSELKTVVDVGGGLGVLLAAVLEKYPHLTGTVFDQEHVVGHKPPPGASPSVEDRWSFASGNFFESVPAADAYLLKSILHDWPDEECVSILRTCRRSLAPGGVVLVVEGLLGLPGHEAEAAFSDLNMLTLPGGRERTEAQYAALFAAADLELSRVVHTSARMSVLEAR